MNSNNHQAPAPQAQGPSPQQAKSSWQQQIQMQKLQLQLQQQQQQQQQNQPAAPQTEMPANTTTNNNPLPLPTNLQRQMMALIQKGYGPTTLLASLAINPAVAQTSVLSRSHASPLALAAAAKAVMSNKPSGEQSLNGTQSHDSNSPARNAVSADSDCEFHRDSGSNGNNSNSQGNLTVSDACFGQGNDADNYMYVRNKQFNVPLTPAGASLTMMALHHEQVQALQQQNNALTAAEQQALRQAQQAVQDFTQAQSLLAEASWQAGHSIVVPISALEPATPQLANTGYNSSSPRLSANEQGTTAFTVAEGAGVSQGGAAAAATNVGMVQEAGLPAHCDHHDSGANGAYHPHGSRDHYDGTTDVTTAPQAQSQPLPQPLPQQVAAAHTTVSASQGQHATIPNSTLAQTGAPQRSLRKSIAGKSLQEIERENQERNAHYHEVVKTKGRLAALGLEPKPLRSKLLERVMGFKPNVPSGQHSS